MAGIEITAETLNGLAGKLDSLDLTDDEQAALDALLDRAAVADADTEGFGVVYEIEVSFKGTDEELQALTAQRLGRSFGFNIGMPPARSYIGETEKP